jgi:hypothetical protein
MIITRAIPIAREKERRTFIATNVEARTSFIGSTESSFAGHV